MYEKTGGRIFTEIQAAYKSINRLLVWSLCEALSDVSLYICTLLIHTNTHMLLLYQCSVYIRTNQYTCTLKYTTAVYGRTVLKWMWLDMYACMYVHTCILQGNTYPHMQSLCSHAYRHLCKHRDMQNDPLSHTLMLQGCMHAARMHTYIHAHMHKGIWE